MGSAFVDVHAKDSRVASLGPVASSVPGAGRKTVEAACAHAEDLGCTTLVRIEGSSVCVFVLFSVRHVDPSPPLWGIPAQLLRSEKRSTKTIVRTPRPLDGLCLTLSWISEA